VLGFYNVIKPTGVSSGYVVNKVKWLTKEKVGHLGTLDPLASGVLPIAVGKATRFFDYFLNKDKVYFALMKVGYLTDTLDSEGEIVEVKKKTISEGDVQKVASSFVGESLQVPPLYSARQVNGVRGYQAALKNKDIVLESKKVYIYSIVSLIL
jgi:tRNA pseudouridine55 synthase